MFYLEKDPYLESDKKASVGISVKLWYPINIFYGVIFRLNWIEFKVCHENWILCHREEKLRLFTSILLCSSSSNLMQGNLKVQGQGQSYSLYRINFMVILVSMQFDKSCVESHCVQMKVHRKFH